MMVKCILLLIGLMMSQETLTPTLIIKPPRLTDYQKAYLYSEKRFTVVEAGTKTGKTYSHIYWIYEQASLGKEGQFYWWVAPVFSQTKIAYRRLKQKLIRYNGLYKFYDSTGDMKIVCPNKATIEFKTAQNPENLYGEDVYAAVFDEFTRARRDAWSALRSTLTATNAPCKLIGNYKGIANWGHQLALKANDPNSEYEYHKITAWDAVRAGILSEKEILQAEKDLPLNDYLALYMCEEVEAENQLITNERIQDFFTNSFVVDGQKYLTADIAFEGADFFTVFVWSGWKIIDYRVFPKSKPEEVVSIIRSMAEANNVPRSNIVYDADGLGTYLSGWLAGANAFHNNGTPLTEQNQKMGYQNLKSQCYWHFSQKVDNAQAWFSVDCEQHKDKIIEDMQFIRNKSYGLDNKFAVLSKKDLREYIGRSTDFSDGMMMRAYLDLKPRFQISGRVVGSGR